MKGMIKDYNNTQAESAQKEIDDENGQSGLFV